MQKPVLVIKLGSAVISNNEGAINVPLIKKLVQEVVQLSQRYNIVLVSSGAVSSGKVFIKNYRGSLIERKAAAAVGNPILIQLYNKYFAKQGIRVAQALCERHHFSNRLQFVQLKDTFAEFWKHNIIPVVNENDLVSNIELKFSDNDELATLLAVGFNAETLILCTSVGGFMNKEKVILPKVEHINEEILGYVNADKSSLGLGGMISKLTFTRLATSLGIKVLMCGLKGKAALTDALNGKSGTTFCAQRSNLKARQKWLASGSITIGSIEVDKGAAKALVNRKSLLTIGIKKVNGQFSAGEVIQVVSEEGTIIGVAKAKLGAEQINQHLSQKNIIAAHADDIVIL
jgi:glutamate 5-kinase